MLLLAGCGSAPLIPDSTLRLTAATTVSSVQIVNTLFLIGAVYVIYDPLAPNWAIEQTRQSEDTFILSLRMKRFHTGGAGEAGMVIRRQAAELQKVFGYRTCQISDWSEGIESHTLAAQRYAVATIRLHDKLPAPVAPSPAPVPPVTGPLPVVAPVPAASSPAAGDPVVRTVVPVPVTTKPLPAPAPKSMPKL